MTRYLWRLVNAPMLIVIGIVLVGIQTSFFDPPYLIFLKPELLLTLIVWLGLKRDFLEGGVLTLICAETVEIHSTAPRGTFFVMYMLAYLSVKGASRYILFPSLNSKIRLSIYVNAVFKIGVLLFIGTLVDFKRQWSHTAAFLGPGLVIQGFVSYFAFKLLERFDWKTYKNPQALRALEDELVLDEEGY